MFLGTAWRQVTCLRMVCRELVLLDFNFKYVTIDGPLPPSCQAVLENRMETIYLSPHGIQRIGFSLKSVTINGPFPRHCICVFNLHTVVWVSWTL
jgi:hypothetical protein